MWKATLKGILAHKFRLALTTLGVVLGVAFVAGTYVLTDTMEQAFDDVFTQATAGVDVEVRAAVSFTGQTSIDRGRIPASVLEDVRGIEGVSVAEAGVSGYAQMVDKQGEAIAPMGPPTLGVSWPQTTGFSALALRQGSAPVRDGEVAIDAATAEKHHFVVGDRIRVLFQGPSENFTIVGILGFGEVDNLGGATLAAFEFQTAQRVLQAGDTLDSVLVQAEEGVSSAQLRNRISTVLPEGVEAVTGEAAAAEQSDAIKEGLGFLSTSLLVFAGVALFVGAFTIFNTFNILVTQRTRELALLRALGAGPGQVTRSVLAEALAVGIVAWVLGLLGGIGLAVGLQALLRAFGIDLPTTGLQVLPRTIIVSLVVGVGVTLAASVAPARRAARIPPIAAMRDVETVRPVPLGRRTIIGGAMVVLGVGVLFAGLFLDVANPLTFVGLGVAIIFLGVSVLSPAISRPLARAIGSPLPRIAAVPGKLGRENAMRNPRRTASTSAALMVGLALVGTFLILGSSLKVSVGRAIEDTLRADYVLNVQGGFVGFSPTLAEQARELDRIDLVSQVRFGEWRKTGSGGTKFVAGVDTASVERVMELDVQAGSVADLDGNSVMIHRSVAEGDGLEIGDTLEMEFASTGVVPMRIAAVFEERRLLDQYVISLDAYQANFAQQLDWMVLLKFTPGTSAEVARQELRALEREFPNVQFQNQAEAREAQEAQINAVLGLVSALLSLAILIALLGIVNTLALSVYERTRELGLIRAVGMSRGQVRRMIRWESVVIALIGGILGLTIGVFFGWALVRALADEGVT
ncbi:MAG TPA: FtsX-like permease family protein, partial [Actinomycetota bacterium]|nr:FtsX-like permease family protein [Actinomycetota bacterium]